jgi:hypothetical protein
VQERRQSKDSAPKRAKWLLAIDAVAWVAMLIMCAGMTMGGVGLVLSRDTASTMSWLYMAFYDAVPFLAGLAWLFFKAIRQLADQGTDDKNLLENFPARVWPLLPVVLPFAVFMGVLFVVIATNFRRN